MKEYDKRKTEYGKYDCDKPDPNHVEQDKEHLKLINYLKKIDASYSEKKSILNNLLKKLKPAETLKAEKQPKEELTYPDVLRYTKEEIDRILKQVEEDEYSKQLIKKDIDTCIQKLVDFDRDKLPNKAKTKQANKYNQDLSNTEIVDNMYKKGLIKEITKSVSDFLSNRFPIKSNQPIHLHWSIIDIIQTLEKQLYFCKDEDLISIAYRIKSSECLDKAFSNKIGGINVKDFIDESERITENNKKDKKQLRHNISKMYDVTGQPANNKQKRAPIILNRKLKTEAFCRLIINANKLDYYCDGIDKDKETSKNNNHDLITTETEYEKRAKKFDHYKFKSLLVKPEFNKIKIKNKKSGVNKTSTDNNKITNNK